MIFVRIRKKNVKYFTNLISVCYFYTKIIDTPIILLLEPFINHLKPLEMRKNYFSNILLLVFLYCFPILLNGQLGFEGHQPFTNIPYNAAPYSFNPNMRQSSGLNFASTATYSNYSTDLFLNFNFDTSGKSIYLVFTTNGSNPSKSNGTVVNGTFSTYLDPNRLWRCNLPAQVTGTMIKYIFYISDSDLASAWGRIDADGYRTVWNESDSNTFDYSNPLPVVWDKFYVGTLYKKTKLNWQTSSEINNDYFEVQYSEDGKTFQSIGKVDGSGNSSRMTQYEFMHENPDEGTSYYRLKQVDFDGKFEYSPVKSIYVSEADVRIFPNPVTDMLHFSGLDDEAVDLIIKDMTGKEVYSVKELSAPSFDISELKNGMYIIYLISPHRTIRERLLKQ